MNTVNRGSKIFSETIKQPHVQKACFGLATDLIVEPEDPTQKLAEDDRKGYKFDEVADVRSLLDQFMIKTAGDKMLSVSKYSFGSETWSRQNESQLGSNDVVMFFRTRANENFPSPIEENADDEALTNTQNQTNYKFTKTQPAKAMRSPQKEPLYQPLLTQEYQQNPYGSPKEASKVLMPEAQEEKPILLKPLCPRPTLLQELAKKVKQKEAEAATAERNKRWSSRRPIQKKKYYDSADYP